MQGSTTGPSRSSRAGDRRYVAGDLPQGSRPPIARMSSSSNGVCDTAGGCSLSAPRSPAIRPSIMVQDLRNSERQTLRTHGDRLPTASSTRNDPGTIASVDPPVSPPNAYANSNHALGREYRAIATAKPGKDLRARTIDRISESQPKRPGRRPNRCRRKGEHSIPRAPR